MVYKGIVTEMISEYLEGNDAIELSMNVIVHAGNARNLIHKAGEQIEDFMFEKAESLLKEAEEELNAAHILQTQYMQREASGETVQYYVLFTHAQDTLMTIISEYNMTMQMMRFVKKIAGRLPAEGGRETGEEKD